MIELKEVLTFLKKLQASGVWYISAFEIDLDNGLELGKELDDIIKKIEDTMTPLSTEAKESQEGV